MTERCLSPAYIRDFGLVHCDLKAGHTGPHQYGGSQVYVEWRDEPELESAVREAAERDWPFGEPQ